MDVVGYMRVSTAEQADSGLGLAAQRAAIELEVERRGWRLVATHEDAGASGKSLANREGLRAALRVVRGGDAQALVVAKLDRLSRSLLDFASLMEQARRERWALVALDLGVDTTTPAGEMIANVMATFAQFERRLIGQRTKDALAVKRAEGVQLGRPPAVPDAVARAISDLRRAGGTWASIAAHLDESGTPTAHGGRRWYPATVRSVYLSRQGHSQAQEVAV